jgi:hypothetical protein
MVRNLTTGDRGQLNISDEKESLGRGMRDFDTVDAWAMRMRGLRGRGRMAMAKVGHIR